MRMLVIACGRRAWTFINELDGLASVEYAVVLAFLVLAALGVVSMLGGTLASTFSTISGNVPDASQIGPHGPASGTFDPVYAAATHLPPSQSAP